MIATFLLLIALSVPSFEQDEEPDLPMSPCPDVFQYEPAPSAAVGPQRRWYGVINLSTDIRLHSFVLHIVLDSKADILGNWIGDVTSADNINFRIQNKTIDIDPDSATALHFFVQYSPLIAAPQVRIIRLNGREICNANKPQPAVERLDQQTNWPSSVRPPDDSPLSPVPMRPNPPNTNPSLSGPPSSIRPGTPGHTTNEQVQCGKVSSAVPLVISGSHTLEGQWPWQIALYMTEGVNLNYKCGGTLVSLRHVITAAHCVSSRHGNSAQKVNHNTLTVYLGKHNLRTSVTGTQIKYVEDIIVHPDYNKAAIFSRDVAILRLHDPVKYTAWVRPACLWPENLIDIKHVIGRAGSVVGWGVDATGAATEDLDLAEMPVVDEITCLRSHNAFFIQFTSPYTYCAGYRNGTSVCLGDSGGGMVFQSAGTWYLRGLVSLSVAGHEKYKCDPFHYTVFTDLAKVLTWIKQNLNGF